MARIIASARSARARINGKTTRPADIRIVQIPAADLRDRWQALESDNERLIDASDPLLAEILAGLAADGRGGPVPVPAG
ncbi:MAG: hypothetical protein ACYCPF_13885 [Streptosporangiaceae bacterium]